MTVPRTRGPVTWDTVKELRAMKMYAIADIAERIVRRDERRLRNRIRRWLA